MSKKKQQTTSEESIARKHEQADIHFGRIIWIGIGLLGLMVVGMLYSDLVGVIFTETSFEPGAPAEVLIDHDASDLPPAPRIEANPNRTWEQFRAREDSVLFSYRWIDRESGIAQIPVERAMEIVLEKKLLESR
ncbi:MAG: hypothetical protein OEV30_10770 [Ignavibacteria bacterium]|nr:hypothetical protein [Ignavibacteria bacterium]